MRMLLRGAKAGGNLATRWGAVSKHYRRFWHGSTVRGAAAIPSAIRGLRTCWQGAREGCSWPGAALDDLLPAGEFAVNPTHHWFGRSQCTLRFLPVAIRAHGRPV